MGNREHGRAAGSAERDAAELSSDRVNGWGLTAETSVDRPFGLGFSWRDTIEGKTGLSERGGFRAWVARVESSSPQFRIVNWGRRSADPSHPVTLAPGLTMAEGVCVHGCLGSSTPVRALSGGVRPASDLTAELPFRQLDSRSSNWTDRISSVGPDSVSPP